MNGCMHGLEIIIANTIQYIKHTKYHAKRFISLFLLSQLPFHYSQSLTTYLDIRFLKKKKNSMTDYFKHMQKQREQLTYPDSASVILTNFLHLHLVSLALLYYFEARFKYHIILCGNVYRVWDSLVVQWVESLSCNAGNTVSIPGWETRIPHATGQLGPPITTAEPTHCNQRACTPQQRIPCDTTKGQINK